MEFTDGSYKHQFIPTSVISFSKIKTDKLIFENDVFIKYEAITEVKGEYIICNDTSKLMIYSKQIVKESYEEYLDFISKRDKNKDRWIYNIIDGLSEQDHLLYRDDSIIVLPTYTWDSTNTDKLHILCFPIDTSLRCIRELSVETVPLLLHMKNTTLCKIQEKYELKEENLKIFCHYDPSTYHLHIHFVNTLNTETLSSVEYSHELDAIIFNLQMDTDYYKKIKLNRRV